MLVRLIVSFALISASVAEPEAPVTMTRMVTRLTSEATKNDPNAARPKTLHRANLQYESNAVQPRLFDPPKDVMMMPAEIND